MVEGRGGEPQVCKVRRSGVIGEESKYDPTRTQPPLLEKSKAWFPHTWLALGRSRRRGVELRVLMSVRLAFRVGRV